MTDYDPAYDPPAPVATVVLRNITSGATVPDVLLLLDTGADVTLLPRAAIEALGVAIVSGLTYDLVGFDGSRTTAHAADLDMIFLKKAFRGRYLLIQGDRGVLGRDVLANVAIILDGPRREWSEFTAPHKPDR